jgi:hypothetical protein
MIKEIYNNFCSFLLPQHKANVTFFVLKHLKNEKAASPELWNYVNLPPTAFIK